ncbi:MAG TPA: HAD hydrolase family protein [Verrucomicrobiota bacterium]|nr:HAD hydrolase family protein [Verrucomicrobiota bacterium]
MSPPIKLVSTDFDGTLFAEFEMPPIPPSIVKLIGDLQRCGTKWVINTGRDMSSLMESLARARIPIQPDYLVLVEREIHRHDGVRYKGDEQWNAACAADHAELFARVRNDVPRLMDWVNSRYNATVYEDAFSPFCLIAGSNGDADEIHRFLDDYARTVPHLTVVRNDVYARFSHADYNKGTALAEIARQINVSPSEIFAAGDHLNDLPMLSRRYAHWLAAPANAMPETKNAVLRENGFVSDLPTGDGVADALERALAQSSGQKESSFPHPPE